MNKKTKYFYEFEPRVKETRMFEHDICFEIKCFIISGHVDHEFDYKTYLEFKNSIGAFDCLHIKTVALLGCSFMAILGP